MLNVKNAELLESIKELKLQILQGKIETVVPELNQNLLLHSDHRSKVMIT
jgi:hypothetical protein